MREINSIPKARLLLMTLLAAGAAALAVSLSPDPALASATSVYVGPGGGSGFAGQCENPDFENADAGAALRDALDPPPDDGSVIYLCAGNYSITNSGTQSFEFTPTGVGDSLSIQGEGQDLVSLENPDEVSAPILVNSDGDLLLSDLTVTGGQTEAGAGLTSQGHLSLDHVSVISNGALVGGGVLASQPSVPDELAIVTITDSTFTGNAASAAGGALFVSGDISISGSTFSGNSSAAGAALVSSAGVEITNSTFTDNFYGPDGPGLIWVDAPTYTFSILNATIAGNSGVVPEAIGPLVGVFGATASVQNLLFEHSSTGPACEFEYPSLNGGNILALGGSSSAGDCSSFISSSIAGLNLEPLADNGGPTETRAITPGSIAINAGVSGALPCPDTDQRGVVRPAGKCDAGAFEYRDLERPLLRQDGKPGKTALRVKTGCGNEFACRIRLSGVLLKRSSGRAEAEDAADLRYTPMKALKPKTVKVKSSQVRSVRLEYVYFLEQMVEWAYMHPAGKTPLKVKVTARESNGRERSIVVDVGPPATPFTPTG